MGRDHRFALATRGAWTALWRPLRPESPDLLHLDCLRFLAACAVVFLHYSSELPALAHVAQIQRAGIAVDLFFVISGAVLTHVYLGHIRSWPDYPAFLWKRIARLVPLHWATLAVYVVLGAAITVAGALKNPVQFEWDCLPQTALMAHAFGACRDFAWNGPSWSISAEMAIYLLFPAALFGLGRRPWWGLAIMAALIATLTARFGDEWLWWSTDGGVARALPSFLFGIALYGLRPRLARIPCTGALMWAALAGAVGLVAINAGGLWLLGAVYLIATLGIAADARGKSGILVRMLAPQGRLTYSLYMIHSPVLFVLGIGVADHLLRLDGAAKAAAVIVIAGIAYVLSRLSLACFETPARRWLTRQGSAAVVRPEVVAAGAGNSVPVIVDG